MANLPAPKIKVEIIDLSDEEDVKPVIVNGVAQEPPKDNSASAASSLNQSNNDQQSSTASTNLNENSTINNNNNSSGNDLPNLEDTQNDSNTNNIGARPRVTDEARKQRIAEYRRKRLEYKKSLRASRKRLELRMAAELVRDIENKLMQNLY